MLIALGGPPGAGKTTLAYALKNQISALANPFIADEDEIRRKLLGYDLRVEMQDPDYAPDVTKRVRARMDALICEALQAGQDVIDTSGFWSQEGRTHIEALARKAGAPFIGLWLTAPVEVLETRLARRVIERAKGTPLSVEKGHASDACPAVLEKYRRIYRESATRSWININADKALDEVLADLAQSLKL